MGCLSGRGRDAQGRRRKRPGPGEGGNDTICRKSGKDVLRGGGGNNKLIGGSGTETCKGGPGKDKTRGCERGDGGGCGGGGNCDPSYPGSPTSSSATPRQGWTDCSEANVGKPISHRLSYLRRLARNVAEQADEKEWGATSLGWTLGA